MSEFRSAARGLAKWRSVAVAVPTLAIGIGAATALYAVARVSLAGLPDVPAMSRVGRIYAANPGLGVERGRVSLGEFDQALSKASSFEAIGAYADEDALVGIGPAARPAVAGYASPAFFAAMGVLPAAGRVFAPADLTGPPVVVVSDALWKREFADGRLADAKLRVDSVDRTVIGVMPPTFEYGFVDVAASLWIPLEHASRSMPAIVNVFARLRDGVEWPAAERELTGMTHGQGPWTFRAISLAKDTRGRAVVVYVSTLGPACLVLILACLNVACLLLARGIGRDRELTVRRALGATRFRLMGLLLVESLILAIFSGAIGAALAAWLVHGAAPALAAVQPRGAAALAGVRLLPVAMAASTIACLLFGMVPALRLSTREVTASLNGVPGVRRTHVAGYGARDVIVFTEIAAAVGLAVWTAMVWTLASQLHGQTLTFAADHVVAMRAPDATVVRVAARVAAVPGVAASAISSGMIGGGRPERIETGDGSPLVFSRVPVGDRFFETLALPMLHGRAFDAAETNARAAVAVLSESAARRLAPGGDAVGRRLQTSTHGDLTVIGVCRDPIDAGALGAIDAGAGEMYVPYEPSMTSREAVVLARVPGDARLALDAIAAAAQVPPGSPPARPVVLSDNFAERAAVTAAPATLALKILGPFAVLALLLAASGVFAVISQSVSQRTREFSIRLAIGATRPGVLRLVLVREGKLIAAAAATGFVFTMMATLALFEQLATLASILPSFWVGALLLSAGVAAVSVMCATYRITRLEPAAVLRRL